MVYRAIDHGFIRETDLCFLRMNINVKIRGWDQDIEDHEGIFALHQHICIRRIDRGRDRFASDQALIHENDLLGTGGTGDLRKADESFYRNTVDCTVDRTAGTADLFSIYAVKCRTRIAVSRALQYRLPVFDELKRNIGMAENKTLDQNLNIIGLCLIFFQEFKACRKIIEEISYFHRRSGRHTDRLAGDELASFIPDTGSLLCKRFFCR